METVDPIRSMEEINMCYAVARKHDKTNKYKAISWELVLLIGLSTALRCSDMVTLKAKDFRYSDVVTVKAIKTGKKTTMGIPAEIRKRILEIIKPLKDDEYIFRSRKTKQPITRHGIYYAVKEIAEEAGIKTPVGTHTLRKTFAYHYYMETNDIASLQDILQHTKQSDTLRYIGITEDLRNERTRSFTALVPSNLNDD